MVAGPFRSAEQSTLWELLTWCSASEKWAEDSIEEKLDVISQLEKGGQIVGIHCNVRYAHVTMRIIHNNAD
jgi:hypothetical protein